MASHDRREFDKYLKFLTHKVTQVVIQSRQGRRIETRSAPHGNEWFNVTVQDDKQVSSELKHSLEGRLPQQDSPVCIEISMETLEGESLVLEVWSVAIDYRQRDIGVSVTHLLYPRLSLILKSVICLSRTTPAYRLSRQQEDNIKFTFRIYTNLPKGIEDFKHCQFAKTSCPYGTLSLSLSYRPVIAFPDRASSVSLANDAVEDIDANASDSLLSRKIMYPFIPKDSPTNVKHDSSLQLFSAILPQPAASTDFMTFELPSTSRQDSGNSLVSGMSIYSREDSNQLSTPKESDDFIMVDLGEIKPLFAQTDDEEISNFLQPNREVPELDLFSCDGSTDVATALKIIGERMEDNS